MNHLNPSINSTDRRKYPRKACDLFLKFSLTILEFFELKRISAKGTCVDISKGGIGLTTQFQLEPGHVLLFTTNEELLSHKIGIVKWVRGEGHNTQAGIQFVS